MTVDLERYRQLKAAVDRMQQSRQRARGALDQLLGRLREEFGCGTLEEAEKKLKKLKAEAKRAEQQFSDAWDKFQERWAEALEGES